MCVEERREVSECGGEEGGVGEVSVWRRGGRVGRVSVCGGEEGGVGRVSVEERKELSVEERSEVCGG